MYKLLIVEDEDMLRDAIVNSVSWRNYGFEVLEAPDGEEGLRLALEHQCDIVLTDIRMPFMDGLELSAALKDQLPDSLVVILSGHDEFSYAQKALALGVKEYLSKPIRPVELIEVMTRLHKELDKRRATKYELSKLRGQVHQSLPLLRQKILNRLIATGLKDRQMQSTLEFVGLGLRGYSYTVCLLSADFPPETAAEDFALYNFAIQNILSEEVGTDGECFEDTGGNHALIYCARTRESERPYLFNMLENICETLCATLEITITASVGFTVESLKELDNAYSSACLALEQQLLQGKGNIYDISDYVSRESTEQVSLHKCQELLSKIKLSTQEELSGQIDDFFIQLRRCGHIKEEHLRVMLIDIVNGTQRLLIESGNAVEPSGIYQTIFALKTLDDCQSALTAYLLGARKQLESVRTSRSTLLIEKVKDYIRNNYSDSSMSLNTAASQVFISPAYLSILFKRELGSTFIDYVTACRLDKARELLRLGGLKTYEVAEKVGYNDPQYFSSCFKKYTGMTPSEYKGTTHQVQ